VAGSSPATSEPSTCILAEEPMNSYQVIATLTERTDGAWKPSRCRYPALNNSRTKASSSLRQRGHQGYRLTQAGTAAPGSSPTPHDPGADAQAHRPSHPHDAGQVWARYAELAHALHALTRSGSQAQHEAAAVALADLQRRIYGILAESPAPAETTATQAGDAES
jgi:hypothetical protein